MSRLPIRLIPVALVILAVSAGTISAQNYDDDGFFVFVDAAFLTPQNTDQVVAITTDNFDPGPGESSNWTRHLPDWGSSAAAQLQFGYRWINGNAISISYWQFDDDQRVAGEAGDYGYTNFTIGPASYYSSYYGSGYFGASGYPGSWDFNASVEASTLDVTWDKQFEPADRLVLDWSLGIRFASFEEALDGTYSNYTSTFYPTYLSYYSYGARKTNESSMVGFKAGLRADYYFTDSFSLDGGLGWSFLDGEVEARSSNGPNGTCNSVPGVNPCGIVFDLPTGTFSLDDDRSGNILDFDLNIVWHIADDRYRVRFGYYHSKWDGIAADLSRNQAGQTFTTLDSRNSVSFSGFRIGVGFLF